MIKNGTTLYKKFVKRLKDKIERDKDLSQKNKINIALWGKIQTNIELCEIIKADKYLSKIIEIKTFISSPEYVKAETIEGYNWRSSEWLRENYVDLIIIASLPYEQFIVNDLSRLSILDKAISLYSLCLIELVESSFHCQYEKIIDPIMGFLTYPESQALYSLAKKINGDGVIVEIGNFQGRSTVSLGLGSKDGHNTKIYSIDPHEGHPATFYESFQKNLKETGVDNIVEPVKKFSLEAAQDFDKPVELIFIDGSHTYYDVRDDFMAWSPKVVYGGYIVLHDRFWPGVFRLLVESILFSKQFQVVDFYNSITVIQKVENKSLKDKINAAKKFKELALYMFNTWSDYCRNRSEYKAENNDFVENVRKYGCCTKRDTMFLRFIDAISKKKSA